MKLKEAGFLSAAFVLAVAGISLSNQLNAGVNLVDMGFKDVHVGMTHFAQKGDGNELGDYTFQNAFTATDRDGKTVSAFIYQAPPSLTFALGPHSAF